ncbi:hypothetical protein X975_02029, partial [Stegodyphus mimosarum]
MYIIIYIVSQFSIGYLEFLQLYLSSHGSGMIAS